MVNNIRIGSSWVINYSETLGVEWSGTELFVTGICHNEEGDPLTNIEIYIYKTGIDRLVEPKDKAQTVSVNVFEYATEITPRMLKHDFNG